MFRFRTLTRLMLMLSMMAVAAGSGHASAQFLEEDEGVYVSEVTGLEISHTEDWEITDSQADGTDSELITLESDGSVLIIGFALIDDPEAGVESAISEIEDAEFIDQGADDGFAWGLASVEDAFGYVYVESESGFADDYQLVAAMVAESDAFVDEFELVQDTVSIDGGFVFVEHDAAELEALIESGSTGTEVESATPEDDVNETETGGSGGDASDDENSHQFELQPVEVVVADPVSINDVQFEDGSYEQVLLVGNGSFGAVSLISSPLGADATLDGFMGGFVSEMDGSEEIDSGEENGIAWSLYSATVGGSEMYVYATVDANRYEDLHHLELIAAPVEVFEDEFVDFQDSVDVDGAGMFADIDIADVMDIIEGI